MGFARNLKLLGDEINVSFGILIILDVAAKAAAIAQDADELLDAEGTVTEVESLHGAGDLAGLAAAASEEEDALGIQPGAELAEDGFLLREREVKGAVPGGNEVVFFGQLPLADIGHVEGGGGAALLGEGDHLGGDIHALGGEAPLEEKIDKSPVAAAANIERRAGGGDKFKGALQRREPIGGGNGLLIPPGELVVVGSDFRGLHDATTLREFFSENHHFESNTAVYLPIDLGGFRKGWWLA